MELSLIVPHLHVDVAEQQTLDLENDLSAACVWLRMYDAGGKCELYNPAS
jgi:hypothetical protein